MKKKQKNEAVNVLLFIYNNINIIYIRKSENE